MATTVFIVIVVLLFANRGSGKRQQRKQCMRCGGVFAAHANFCGQCGNSFASSRKQAKRQSRAMARAIRHHGRLVARASRA